MKLKDFISKEDLREDLDNMTGDPEVDFPEDDINEEINNALEQYQTVIEDAIKDSDGLSLESLQNIHSGLSIIRKIRKDETIFSLEEHESLYLSNINTLAEIKRLKGE